MEIKPEINEFLTCIACLRDESKVRVENNQESKVTNIYNVLVREINQRGLSSILICNICKQKLLTIGKFQKQCLESIEILKNKANIKPEVIFIKEEEIDSDDVDNEQKEEDTDSSTDESYSSHEGQTCDEQSDEKSEIDVRKKKNKSYKQKTSPIKMKTSGNRYNCNQCDSSYVKHIELKRHIMKKHQGGQSCKYCRNVFLDKDEYNRHLQEEQAKIRADPTVCCELCGYTTKWKPGLRHHITKYHTPDQPKLICDVCGKCYLFRAQFKHHFISSHMEKEFQCNECGKKFAINYDLKKHIRDYHTPEGTLKGPNALVKCKYCNKMMKGSSMQQHVRIIHCSLKNHVCKICSKGFTRFSVLKRHILIHERSGESGQKNIKTVSCNECGLDFKTKPELAQHQKSTHLDKETLEKNYVSCKFCDEKLRPSSLQMHVLRRHIDAKKFKCDQCEKAFNNSSSLQVHKYTHTGERPFCCDICSNGYTKIDTLKKHYKSAHNLEYTNTKKNELIEVHKK